MTPFRRRAVLCLSLAFTIALAAFILAVATYTNVLHAGARP